MSLTGHTPLSNRPAFHVDTESLDRIFSPRSIAVIGASPRGGSVGNTVLVNLISGGF